MIISIEEIKFNLDISENVTKVILRDAVVVTPSGGVGSVISVNNKTGEVVLSTADIADSSNKRYITEAKKTILGNTSGTNSGDQDLSGYALLATYRQIITSLPIVQGLSHNPHSQDICYHPLRLQHTQQ